MLSLPRNILTLVFCLGLGACATHPRLSVPEAPIKAPVVHQAIGRISLVNTVQGFALIESSQTFETGTELQTRSIEGKETSVLKVTPETKNPFIIADIVKGKPQVGETVLK